MKTYFSIDALSVSGSHAWRLQQSSENPPQWRECIYAEALKKHDARLNKQQAEAWVMMRMRKDKDSGLIKHKKAGIFDFLMRGIFTHAVLHRLSAAPLPDKAQMLATLAELEPGTPWLLYLDIAGHFQALNSEQKRIVGNLDICVRGEIASSAEYIGEKAAQKNDFMDELYLQFLAGWLEHLTTSNMAIFIPDVSSLKEECFYTEAIATWQYETTLND